MRAGLARNDLPRDASYDPETADTPGRSQIAVIVSKVNANGA